MEMKHALVIRHLAFEDLGTFADLLQARGYNLSTLDAAVDDLAQVDVTTPDLVVFLGGPIGAFDELQYPFLAHELALVRQRLASGGKLLGICLGAQLIARALGSEVAPMGVKEIGFGRLTLTQDGVDSCLAPLAADIPVLHWHGDQFQVPPQATRLAGTAICPNQAFSVGGSVLALQFHLEVNPQRLEPWLVGHAAELGMAGILPADLRKQASAMNALVPAAQAVLSHWLDLV
ncbi:GMP synthase (glutamine-hydrolyzing) [Pseudomonas sp. TE3610]